MSTERVVEGLRHVVEDRERAIHGAVSRTDNVVKRDVHVWRKLDDLADAATKHAERINAAVTEYRSAKIELEQAEAALDVVMGRTETAGLRSEGGE